MGFAVGRGYPPFLWSDSLRSAGGKADIPRKWHMPAGLPQRASPASRIFRSPAFAPFLGSLPRGEKAGGPANFPRRKTEDESLAIHRFTEPHFSNTEPIPPKTLIEDPPLVPS